MYTESAETFLYRTPWDPTASLFQFDQFSKKQKLTIQFHGAKREMRKSLPPSTKVEQNPKEGNLKVKTGK